MFLQLRLSRDGARLRGAPGQAAGGGRVPSAAHGPSGPTPGVEGAGRRAEGADLGSGTGASSRVPPTWSPALPRTKELIQTRRQAGRMGRRKREPTCLGGGSSHSTSLPRSSRIAFVTAPTAATSNEFSSA